MMNSYVDFPAGYKEIEHVDLQKDKKLAFLVNGIGVIIMVITFLIGHAIVPFWSFYGFTGMYAYAGSNCYFDKKSYISIALAPIVV